MSTAHTPVLADTIAQLAHGAQRIADCTVGAGGHAGRFRAAGADVFAVDRDPEALARARKRLGDKGITWRLGRFGDPAVTADIARFKPDFILLDLGISSDQLDTDPRGFSFRPNVPLDMRMTPSGPTAADLLNTRSAIVLAEIFRSHADEPRARRLANKIVQRRSTAQFRTSDDLVNAIRSAFGPRTGPSDFARLFQAMRIAVNDELGELERALPGLREALIPGGRLAVITYHSGEDRIVKHAFREWERPCVCPPGQPICTCRGAPLGRREPRSPITPAAEEIERNPRARSAKLRIFRTADGA